MLRWGKVLCSEQILTNACQCLADIFDDCTNEGRTSVVFVWSFVCLTLVIPNKK